LCTQNNTVCEGVKAAVKENSKKMKCCNDELNLDSCHVEKYLDAFFGLKNWR